MAGNYKLFVTFPFQFDGAKSSRIQLEPFASVRCYGLVVKVILELTCGSGESSYNVERVVYEEAITQENIQDGFMSSPFIETMEAFYFCKVDKEVLVPVCAMILKRYFADILEAFGIYLDDYIIDIEYQNEEIGFKRSGASNVSNNQTNRSIYSKTQTVEDAGNGGDDQEEARISCKEIVQGLKEKSKKRKSYR
jgi:hypothetical protein